MPAHQNVCEIEPGPEIVMVPPCQVVRACLLGVTAACCSRHRLVGSVQAWGTLLLDAMKKDGDGDKLQQGAAGKVQASCLQALAQLFTRWVMDVSFGSLN